MMHKTLLRLTTAMLAAGLTTGSALAQGTTGLPEYLANISGTTAPSAADLATRDVLQLNTSMFALYDSAARTFRRNIMAKQGARLRHAGAWP
jgi:hypothetical protein